jgi:NADP-dependent 3-hydroxy acid dehydrogenase YdfG
MGALGGALALVTGASRGIGAAAAERLRQEGATVIRISRTAGAADGDGWIDLRADLTDEREAADALGRVLDRGVPDVVVNNAGSFGLGPLEAGVDELDRLYRINLQAPYRVAAAILPAMRSRGSGRHILIGSISDHRAFSGNAAYAATKFGARGLHEVLREEFRGSGVLCSLISPGPVDTTLWDAIDQAANPGLPARESMLRPADVAEAVLWVATRPARVDVDWLRLGPS